VVLLFHLFSFMEKYNKVLFSYNNLAFILAKLSKYGYSTIKKDLSNKNFDKLISRVKETDEEFANILNNIVLYVFENKCGETFNLIKKESLRDFQDLYYIQKLIIENKKIKNFEVLKKFLEKEEIEDILNKNFQMKNLISLKAFHYQFCLYMSDFFKLMSDFFKLDYEKFVKSFFKVNENACEKNLLDLFFNSKYCNLSYDEKRNKRNIVNQKNIMKFKTFKKYFDKIENEEVHEVHIAYYSFYLYLDYLEFLRKQLFISKTDFCKFIEYVKKEEELKNS